MAELTPLVIVNRACGIIGAEPLESMGEETAGGQSAQMIYDDAVTLLLAVTTWGFLRETHQLARIADATPLSGYAYVHQIPGTPPMGFNRLLRSKDPQDPLQRFEIEAGHRVHCDELTVYAQLQVEAAPHLWPGPFTAAVTRYVASGLALTLAHDKDLASTLRAQAIGTPSEGLRGGLLGLALQVDSRNTPVRNVTIRNPLLDAFEG